MQIDLDRVVGCLGGLAIGDAMGMPTEFLTPEEIQANLGWVTGLVAAPDWHPHARLKTGQITDDTGQALAVAHAYSASGELSAAAVARELRAWRDSLPPDELKVMIGPSTVQALQLIEQGVDPTESGRNGKTNGAAMRVAAVGLVHPADGEAALRDAIQACLPTHGTMVAIAGAAAVACAIAEALRKGATLASILQAGKTGAQRGSKHGAWSWGTRLESRIELAEGLVSGAASEAAALRALYEFVGVDMLVAESVAAAFGLVILSQGDPMKAVVLGANIGGDTDTIAAIAGSICGAWRGRRALDARLLRQVEAVNGLDITAEAQRLAEIMDARSFHGFETQLD